MTTIYLVRHGETNWNAEKRMQGQTDIPLNDKGEQQATLCGAALKPEDYDVVISSQLQRAKRTAEIINQYLELPFEVMEDFAERHFGDAEGLTFDERNELYPDHEYPNQEELEAFSTRVMNGLEKVRQKHPNKRVLLVAHGAVIYRILSNLSETEINLSGRKIENTSISTIYWQDNNWVIQDYNQIDHLKQITKA
ncbi:histidine phosphatase family protein [Ornithinibacillus massiliensis]|uniref:Histidine phosphatase family protein n=1 Tax=Ornithinibacillus massiliensis TaxID=1944633 RepID=A0ABS5MAB7_9BACI|nr:histidine phosphatase family protein [Ornithinibacillus massiliensis]